jgi:hypothetical protein
MFKPQANVLTARAIGLTAGGVALRLNLLPHQVSRMAEQLKIETKRLGRIRVFSDEDAERIRAEAVRRGLIVEESP